MAVAVNWHLQGLPVFELVLPPLPLGARLAPVWGPQGAEFFAVIAVRFQGPGTQNRRRLRLPAARLPVDFQTRCI